MHFTLFSLSILYVLTTTFVRSAPTAPLDAATLLKNAQEAQKLNAQFQSSNSTAATGPCTDGDTSCSNNAIATCVNGQFVTSNGNCLGTQQCFALPSVRSNGTIIACTSEKSAQSLINASGATGGVTGSESGASTSSIVHPSPSPTFAAPTTTTPTASMDTDCITATATATPTTTESVVTVTVTVTPSILTTLPPVTRTLSPDQASSVLSSLLAAQVTPSPIADPDCEDAPSETTAAASANKAASLASSGSGYGA